MDGSQFDTIVRSFTESRRSLLGTALAATTGWLVTPASEAKKKRKRKKRKKTIKQRSAAPNEFGCIDVGDLCQSGAQCCSGICAGKKGKRTCRAHGAGTCQQGVPAYCQSGIPTYCNDSVACVCMRTTAGSNFCGVGNSPSECANCKTDADCEAMGFPTGSACAQVSSGACTDFCSQSGQTGMVCLAPCGAEPIE